MKPMPVEYYRAESIEDAINTMVAFPGARLLAGGQSLVPMLNLRIMPVSHLVDIKKIDSLHRVEESSDYIRYGAALTHAQFEDGAVPDACGGLLRHVASGIAYRAVRNRGTVGGALSLADASTDWVTAMLTAGATIIAQGPDGSRRIPMRDFVQSPYQTALNPENEMLVAIEVPRVSSLCDWGYYKIMQKPGEYASSLAGVLRDTERNVSRAVLGGGNRAPVLLEATAGILARAGGWTDQLKAELSQAIASDLAQASRTGEPWEQHSWTNCVLRAARQALAGKASTMEQSS